MVIVRTGQSHLHLDISDELKLQQLHLSVVCSSAMWWNVRGQSGRRSRIVRIRDGDKFWRVSLDIYPPSRE